MYQKSSPETIQEMFGTIAKDYDRANTTFSFGLHKVWNRTLVNSVKGANHLLDLCAGTGEIAFAFLKQHPQSTATLLDFCPEMLEVAQIKGEAFSERFETLCGDAQALPFSDESVDAVTISYGIRNVNEPTRCFREVYRVLEPQGIFAILELTRPSSPLLRFFHKIYLHTLLPALGKLTAKNGEAYKYLASSIEGFTEPNGLIQELHKIGFVDLHRKSLLGGIATIVSARKPDG